LVKQAQGTYKSAKGSIKLSANCVKLNQLDASQGPKVPMVNKFSDGFFEELTVAPPDRDIEYVIE
jgi:hypothetical protein